VFFWFVGGSVVGVWSVLKDPAVDYRLVIVGALVPEVVDAPFGGLRYAHTLAAAVGLLVLVMLGTVGRRRLRRRLLALPIGMLVGIVLDGTWTSSQVFWWPFQGLSLAHAGRVPALAHPVALTAVEEVVGLVAVAWCWRRFELADRSRWQEFLHTGRLGRGLVPPGGTAGLPSPRRRP
jgi:hypothetical protein